MLNDLIGNIRHESGFGGWLLRQAGFAGNEAHRPTPVKLMLVKDTGALRQQILRCADIKGLKRILVSHGEPIEENPRQTLLQLAASLTEVPPRRSAGDAHAIHH